MIRLYPHYVKTEQNISHMRKTLGNINMEGWDKADQLSDATMRIRELGAELGRSELEQRNRHKDFEEAAATCQERYALMQSELESRSQLDAELGQAQAEHESQLRHLAQSEMESKLRWDVILERRAQTSELDMQLGRHAAETWDVQRRLDEAQSLRTKLFSEYGQAEHSAAERRSELREAAMSSSSDASRAAGLQAEARELQREVERLEGRVGALRARIIELEPEVSAHPGLRDEIKAINFGRVKLQDRVGHLSRKVRKRTAERDLVANHVTNLRESIDNEEREFAILKKDSDLLDEETKKLNHLAQDAHSKVREVKQDITGVEDKAAAIDKEMREKAATYNAKAEHCRKQTADLERECRRFRSNLKGDRMDTEEYKTTHADLMRGHARLVARHSEAVKLVQREKKRCHCFFAF